MRLENLYPNFGLATPALQLSYVTSYRLRRAEDMLKTPNWPKPKKVKKKKLKVKTQPLTNEERTLMKLMGLKKKDILVMREMKKCSKQ